MNKDILNTIILSSSFLALFGISELLYHFLKVNVELTRKLSHFGTGILTLLFPIMLGNHWLVLLLCASFAGLLLLSLKFNFLKSINAIDRESVGSIAYPASVYICYFVYEYNGYQFYYFYLPILILAISDPLAALCGKKWPLGKYAVGKNHKTLMGSAVFFISAVVISFVLLMSSYVGTTLFLIVLVAAFLTTIIEAFSKRGFDNLTIPLTALIFLIVMSHI
jgi:phytol kinase